mmetsp:Transcript_8168/g.15295  ORF Transcript_8168/g.15295 Transcript_8168/m.15295 type:complete len:144 (+) Transcript_8168:3-434(+)
MTKMLMDCGAPPPKVKIRRKNLAQRSYFGTASDQKTNLPVPQPVLKASARAALVDTADFVRSRNSFDGEKWHRGSQSSATEGYRGTRSSATEHRGARSTATEGRGTQSAATEDHGTGSRRSRHMTTTVEFGESQHRRSKRGRS